MNIQEDIDNWKNLVYYDCHRLTKGVNVVYQYTIAEALKQEWGGYEYRVYVFRRDREGEVLYVGQSTDPILRLRQHVNPSSKLKIGVAIRDNMPGSLGWLVEIYSLPECDAFVQMHEQGSYVDYLRCQQSYSLTHNSARIAEKAMIAHYAPLYNYPPGIRRRK